MSGGSRFRSATWRCASSSVLKCPEMTGFFPDSMQQPAIYVVNVQLEKVGVRIAAVLNSALP